MSCTLLVVSLRPKIVQIQKAVNYGNVVFEFVGSFFKDVIFNLQTTVANLRNANLSCHVFTREV